VTKSAPYVMRGLTTEWMLFAPFVQLITWTVPYVPGKGGEFKLWWQSYVVLPNTFKMEWLNHAR
jgi:hypothetical protein